MKSLFPSTLQSLKSKFSFHYLKSLFPFLFESSATLKAKSPTTPQVMPIYPSPFLFTNPTLRNPFQSIFPW